MIIADATIWSAALDGHIPGLGALVASLRLKHEVSAPTAVFAEVLAEATDPRAAQQVRTWAMDAPSVNETNTAWLAAGDLGAHLRREGVMLSVLDLFLVALCLREGWSLWTTNSAIHRASGVLPVKLYEPIGIG